MPFLGELYALLTAVMWSGSSVAFGAATRRLGSVQVNVARLVLATLYLWILILAAGVDVGMSRSQFVLLAVSGIVGLALGDTFLFRAYLEIGPRLTMLIMSIAPAIAAILAFLFLDERLPVWGIVGIAVTLGGIVLVVLEQNEGSRGGLSKLGLVLALLASAGQGVGLIFAKAAFLEGEVNEFVATVTRIMASLVLLVPLLLLLGKWRSPAALYREDRRAALLTVLGSFLGPFFGISLSLLAVKNTSVGVASTLMATVPIMMLPLVHYVQREPLSWRAIAGAFIAVGGVALLFLR
jgi:drug/metabolite transporter (DMT)-like permease